MANRRFRFGPFLLDPAECELRRDGAPVEIQPRAFDLLAYLVERAGHLVTRDDLLRDVWGGVFVGDPALTQMLRKVRLALGDDVGAPRYLATVPRRGYRFIATVAVEGGTLPAGPASVPPPPTPLPPTPTIPSRAGLDAFVGRSSELGALVRRVEEGQRLVTLVGAVGVGKSRLARELAAALRRPTVWVDVPGLRHDVAGALARADRATLLVLDDADPALDDLVPALRAWLERPGRTALVTAREGLRMQGEQVWSVRPLPTDTADGAAVELFFARARAVAPAWTPGEGEHEDVRALVAALDGLPLAIEFAASRVRTARPGELLARMDSCLEWLSTDRRDVPTRHRSLAAAIDASWAGLPPPLQAALAQLSAFDGAFDIREAERILDLAPWPEAPSAFGAVDALFGRSLVVRAADGVAPYRLLRCVRGFARHKLVTEGAIDVAGSSWTGPARGEAVRARLASP